MAKRRAPKNETKVEPFARWKRKMKTNIALQQCRNKFVWK
jgi:hypothetical protein